MSVLKLLETLATDPLAETRPGYGDILSSIEPLARAAVLERDPVALAAALGRPVTFACMIAVPEEEEPAQERDPDDERHPDEQDEAGWSPD
ncbi:hypothetical protein [Cognatilysobacter lacus]|uniref:Uncharacterized protein n=1 Tax=Cognatilysobacter lacus TaxID=1643323 RepID=A0A5D8Z3V2_9GAMM|nr:hypothetical protein [Lysobacter lacus]TZF89655.1 hypothetical protein FW784_08400 [Lysobacter lacus]